MRGNPLPQTPLFLPLGASGEAGRRGSEGRCEHGGRTVSDGRCVGATDGGGLLAALFVANRKKRNAKQNKKQTPPLQLLLRQTFPTLSWQNSWPRPPPSLLLFPSPIHSSETNPLFDISPPPPLAVATALWSATQMHAHQRKEASVFHLGEEAVVSHLDGPAVRLAGKRQRRQIQEQRCLGKKKDPYMISLLIRGEDDQGVDLAI